VTFWYRIVDATLAVRESASASAKLLGYLTKGDIISCISDPNVGEWVQIRRADRFTGWCLKKTLIPLGADQPASLQQKIFNNTTYFRKAVNDPRQNVIHVLSVDLRSGIVNFFVTPPSHTNGDMCTRTTTRFMEDFAVHIAINGDGFSYILNPPEGYCPAGRDSVKVNGFAASRGSIYSDRRGPTVYINQNKVIRFNKPQGKVFNAVSGDRMIIENGKQVPNLATNIPNPRTALGVTKNGKGLILMAVDGRQPGYSEGVNFPELVQLMLSYGAYNAINMDGGSSSALVIAGWDGKPVLLSSPIDQNVPGQEASVANHLGIFIQK
jgi:exopolysaccharide biosynthesis protein